MTKTIATRIIATMTTTTDRRWGGPAAALAALAALLAWGACQGAAPRPATGSTGPAATIATPVRLSAAVAREGARVLPLTVRLAGGGGREWVAESCNPVVPVVAGTRRPLRQCLINFYSRVALREGKGELTLEWPLDAPGFELKPGGRVRVAAGLATDCKKSGGPGLFAMGDCKTVELISADAAVEP